MTDQNKSTFTSPIITADSILADYKPKNTFSILTPVFLKKLVPDVVDRWLPVLEKNPRVINEVYKSIDSSCYDQRSFGSVFDPTEYYPRTVSWDEFTQERKDALERENCGQKSNNVFYNRVKIPYELDAQEDLVFINKDLRQMDIFEGLEMRDMDHKISTVIFSFTDVDHPVCVENNTAMCPFYVVFPRLQFTRFSLTFLDRNGELVKGKVPVYLFGGTCRKGLVDDKKLFQMLVPYNGSPVYRTDSYGYPVRKKAMYDNAFVRIIDA